MLARDIPIRAGEAVRESPGADGARKGTSPPAGAAPLAPARVRGIGFDGDGSTARMGQGGLMGISTGGAGRGTFSNPIAGVAVGDPFVLRWRGRFYLYGTND